MFWPDTLLVHSVAVRLKPVPNGVECFVTRVVFRGDKPVTTKPRRMIVHDFRRIVN